MNTQRIIVLGIALVAAGGAALLVRGLLGGGTQVAAAKPAPQMAMSEVLVANVNLTPGQKLSVDQIRWEKWPTATVDPSFITHDSASNEEQLVKGTVVRAMVLAGPAHHQDCAGAWRRFGLHGRDLERRHARDLHRHLSRLRRRRFHSSQ